MSRSHIHLGAVPLGAGGYGQHRLWLDPEVPTNASVDIDWYTKIAQMCERARFDFMFVPDSQFAGPRSSPHSLNRLEPLTLLSAVAPQTDRIGLVATASTSFNSPYNLARRLASLDVISNGRAGWNVVTTGDPKTASNFGLNEHYSYETRYGMAGEFVNLARKLWDSYEDDAFLGDRENVRFLDRSRQHPAQHEGEYLNVAGSLNIQRSSQGHPVIFQSGDSEYGRDLGASIGEAIFTNAPSANHVAAFYADLKDRARRLGRDPDQVLIFPSIRVVVGDSDSDAREIEALRHERDHPFDEAFAELERWFGWYDFSQYDLDAKFPIAAMSHAARSYYSRASRITDLARTNNWTLRETIEANRASRKGDFVGAPRTVAAELQSWWESRACDGFVIGVDHPSNFRRFLRDVIPILQDRGLFRAEYESSTLRGNLALPIPENRHTRDRRAGL